MEGLSDAARLRDRLRAALRVALRERDPIATAAIRSAVSAIDNAEAVDQPHAPHARLGVGVGDVARRELSANEIVEILQAEIVERDSAAAEYERTGRAERATRLRAEAAALSSLLDDAGSP
jgi:uncharacterized protein YqeY